MGDSLKSDEVETSSFEKIFYEQFPYYLAMGMDYDLFWRQNPFLVKCYRKAYKLKQETKEYELWKQGLYFYEALNDVSPVLQAFAKNGTRPRPYSKKPYGIEEYEKDNREIKTKEENEKDVEKERLKARLHFMNLTRMLQKSFKENEGK